LRSVPIGCRRHNYHDVIERRALLAAEFGTDARFSQLSIERYSQMIRSSRGFIDTMSEASFEFTISSISPSTKSPDSIASGASRKAIGT
jgi:hypothetical protein